MAFAWDSWKNWQEWSNKVVRDEQQSGNVWIFFISLVVQVRPLCSFGLCFLTHYLVHRINVLPDFPLVIVIISVFQNVFSFGFCPTKLSFVLASYEGQTEDRCCQFRFTKELQITGEEDTNWIPRTCLSKTFHVQHFIQIKPKNTSPAEINLET